MFRYFRDICTELGQGSRELGEATGEEGGASKEPCVEDGSGGAIDILRYTGPLPKRPGPLS